MKILLGLSGGLDSAYSATKLIEAGHTVEGATLVMHDYTDISECERLADELGIALHIIDCKKEFAEIVKNNFVNEYVNGRTPNPCIICNSEIKFKMLHKYAKENGFDKIATGHYARLEDFEGSKYLNFAKDRKKDQTYMLWRLPKEILDDLILPLSDEAKSEIRKDAYERGMSVASKEESQEICFIPDGNYVEFIENRVGKLPRGNFIDKGGKILGEHRGIINYTVGQRKGLGIALGQRVFVTDINPLDNTVTLSLEDDKSSEVSVEGVIFADKYDMKIGETRVCDVKLRYLQPPVKCRAIYLGENRMSVELSEPQRAVTPGQSAVFYDGDRLIMGGFITRSALFN